MRSGGLSYEAREHFADIIQRDVHQATVGNVLISVEQNGEIAVSELVLPLPSGREVMVGADREGSVCFKVGPALRILAAMIRADLFEEGGLR